MNYRTQWWKIFVFMVLIFTSITASAQELCEEIAREVFEETNANCSEANNESVCYGYSSISSTFFQDVGDGFQAPSDLVELLQLQTLRSFEYDAEVEEWGVGYFQVGLDESTQPLIILTTGNVIVENAVDTANEEGLNLMQAFNFTTGGPSSCQQAPNAVFIQGPEDVTIDLVVNSTPLRLGSTVVLGTLDENTDDDQPQDDTMWIAVIEGQVISNPGTDQEVIIEEGTVSTVPLTDANGDIPNGGNLIPVRQVPVIDPLTGEPVPGLDGEPFYRQIPYEAFSEPEPISEDGSGIFDINTYAFINDIPASLLNYDVEVEIEEDVVEEPVPESSPVVVNTPVPAPSEQVVQSNDPNVTECGSLNWCNSGEPWGDGRCNDPDPDLSSWYWNAGWYQAQLECGAIESIPQEFGPLPTAVPVSAPATSPYPTAGCTLYDSVGGLPGTYYINFNGGNFLNPGQGLTSEVTPCGTPGSAGFSADTVAFANDATTAAQICISNGAPGGSVVLRPGVTQVWVCQ